MMRYCIFLALLLVGIQLNSQIVCSQYHLESNKTTLPDSIKNLSQRSIMFFCAMYGMDLSDSLMYINTAEEFCKDTVFTNLGELHVYFFFFKEDPKNNANGIVIPNRNGKIGVTVSQQACFFVNFDRNLLDRAHSKMKNSFDVKETFNQENFFQVAIVEGKQCFRKIQDRIPFYSDFIKESIRPTYTVEERLQQVVDTLNTVKASVVRLERQNILWQSKYDSIREVLNKVFIKGGK